MRLFGLVVGTALVAAFAAGPAEATLLSIYEVQYTTDPAGGSPHVGTVVDCSGGIVTHKFGGSKPKLTLQDPNSPDGWGGIQAKDWTGGSLFDSVSIGDWVSLGNVMVEEYRGNTLLQFHSETNSGFVIESTGNPLPAARLVSPSEIPAPLQNTDPANLGWYVADHAAEKYEAMRLLVENVTVGEMDHGKAGDNYELGGPGGVCWASDYMNEDAAGEYHPYISPGATFQSVTGVLEQYTKIVNGWDYYQLLTTTSDDFLVPEPATCMILLCGGVVIFRRNRLMKSTVGPA